MNETWEQTAEVVGDLDRVAGFDLETQVEESIDFLDVYKMYLGDEYTVMKGNYSKAIEILNQTYKLKNEWLGY